MKYRLGTIDHGFVPRKLTVCYAAICIGEVDTALLQQAFELLCRKYPMLGGTIEIADGECYLRLPDSGSSTATMETVDDTIANWLAGGATPLDPAHALAKLEVVPDVGATAVGLIVCHAINDAQMGFALLADFWRIAAALSGTTTLPDLTAVYPHSLEDRYRERGLALPEPNLPAAGPVRSLPASDALHGRDFRPTPTERISLSSHDTGELLRHAHALGTTVHALISAAIIRAERAMLPESSTPEADLPMIMFHLVDLRPQLHPPAQPADVTNALGYAPTITACGPDSDLQVLSKEAKDQIVRAIDSGTALATMLAAASLATVGRSRNTASFITNWGVVPTLDSPKGMEIIDFRGFATSEPVPMVGYFVYTFQGRLTIELASSGRFHRPTQLTDLRSHIAANLEALTKPS